MLVLGRVSHWSHLLAKHEADVDRHSNVLGSTPSSRFGGSRVL